MPAWWADEIEKNDFNLNLPRYIDSSTPEDLQDIDAHLNGGIPEADVQAQPLLGSVPAAARACSAPPAGLPGPGRGARGHQAHHPPAPRVPGLHPGHERALRHWRAPAASAQGPGKGFHPKR
jgi:hypothetical protein